MAEDKEPERETPEHLEGVDDGSGCVELWEAISESVDDDGD